MILRIEAGQVKQCWRYLSECLNRSFPSVQEQLKTGVLHDLLLGDAQGWLITEGDSITTEAVKAVFITRINDDLARGGRVLTVLAACAFNGADEEMFMEGFGALKLFGQKMGCSVLDFYTNNSAIINYIKLFKTIWHCQYYQLDLGEK